MTAAPSGNFSLSVVPAKRKGRHAPELSWSGANGNNVDIFRDGNLIETAANNGFYVDNIGARGGRTYIYKVCEEGTSTWIVECGEDAWRAAGLDSASEEETVRYCEKVFEKYLDGHPLLTNRSVWRQFPTVRNGTWHHENIVLIGDAAHTAHFSIGSGTKLAMEDAIHLVEALTEVEGRGAPESLRVYEDRRRLDVAKLQRAASVSQRWFEDISRYKPARGEDLTKAPRTSHDTDLDHLIDIATTTKQPIVIQDDKGKDVGVVNKSTLLKGIQGFDLQVGQGFVQLLGRSGDKRPEKYGGEQALSPGKDRNLVGRDRPVTGRLRAGPVVAEAFVQGLQQVGPGGFQLIFNQCHRLLDFTPVLQDFNDADDSDTGRIKKNIDADTFHFRAAHA